MPHLRTRFAPSPTGFMHVGNMRTAVFAWLAARSQNGQFILRLEDTDKAREVTGSDQHIIDCLKALGLTYDEGPDVGGDFGPYRQSERLQTYHRVAEQLVKAGRAYGDPYSKDEVDAFRQQARSRSEAFLYRHFRPPEAAGWQEGQPLRFKSEPKSYSWHDIVMGDLSTPPEVIDDFILIKSDGYPTYNFAHVVDDALMKISLVIRGQEFLASVPNYLNLHEALGYQPPQFATVPPVLAPGGQRKLSKRDGQAKDILEYTKEGYLPSALINFMASLGWNDGTEQEVYSVKELIKSFALKRVQKSGALFDEERLKWLSGAHIRRLPLDELMGMATDYWPAEASEYNDAYKKRVLGSVQERLKYFQELPSLTIFFFKNLPLDNKLIKTHKQLSKLSTSQLKDLLVSTRRELEDSSFELEDITARLNKLLADTNQKPVVLFSLIRIALTRSPASPGLADTLAILGKERSLKLIDEQITAL